MIKRRKGGITSGSTRPLSPRGGREIPPRKMSHNNSAKFKDFKYKN